VNEILNVTIMVDDYREEYGAIIWYVFDRPYISEYIPEIYADCGILRRGNVRINVLIRHIILTKFLDNHSVKELAKNTLQHWKDNGIYGLRSQSK